MEEWRALYGPVHKLMRDQELILRFLALYYDADQYSRPMKGFLNNFMGRNKHLSAIPAEKMRSVFTGTIAAIHQSIGKGSFRPARVFNAAVFDAVMVGVAQRLDRGPILDRELLKERYTNLIESPGFLAVAERSTADEENVSKRLDLATAAFADVP